jgi:hypothetical protein
MRQLPARYRQGVAWVLDSGTPPALVVVHELPPSKQPKVFPRPARPDRGPHPRCGPDAARSRPGVDARRAPHARRQRTHARSAPLLAFRRGTPRRSGTPRAVPVRNTLAAAAWRLAGVFRDTCTIELPVGSGGRTRTPSGTTGPSPTTDSVAVLPWTVRSFPMRSRPRRWLQTEPIQPSTWFMSPPAVPDFDCESMRGSLMGTSHEGGAWRGPTGSPIDGVLRGAGGWVKDPP